VATTGEAFWWNAAAALTCVGLAAVAAGLTLGMLDLDPLMLLIKERAAAKPVERRQAKRLLPMVKQHHRLLVTLLLMNSIANEALPIFLEALVPPSVAILLSVTIVLFFGEIIPSAYFTGPNQLQTASRFLPLVQAAMCLLYPVAGPIAKLLDWLLHDDNDDESEYAHGDVERAKEEKRRVHQDREHVRDLSVVHAAHHLEDDLQDLSVDAQFDELEAEIKQEEEAEELLHQLKQQERDLKAIMKEIKNYKKEKNVEKWKMRLDELHYAQYQCQLEDLEALLLEDSRAQMKLVAESNVRLSK
jgi:Mg2+/Co2+ transporter CorB